jgi:hypothetical protein
MPQGEGATTIADMSMDSTAFPESEGMTTMRPIRTIATALLAASLAAAGCGHSQPDQPTPPSQPPVVTAPPTPPPPNPDPTPAPGPAARPHILSVITSPTLPTQGGFLRLPAGAGTVVFRVRAINAQRVGFYLTPTGTRMFNENQLIGQDTNGRDGWSLVWHFKNEPLLAHLTIAAIGANGASSPWVTLGLHTPTPPPASCR